MINQYRSSQLYIRGVTAIAVALATIQHELAIAIVNDELGNFFSFPHTFQDDVLAINYISIAFPIKQFSLKFILRVTV